MSNLAVVTGGTGGMGLAVISISQVSIQASKRKRW